MPKNIIVLIYLISMTKFGNWAVYD